jgi:hypothetical protein
MGKKQSSLDITRLYIPAEAANTQQLTIKLKIVLIMKSFLMGAKLMVALEY